MYKRQAPDLVAELANECKNIVAIKEASGDIAQVAEVARLVPDDFAIYSGNDDSITPVSYTHLDVYKRQSPIIST